MNAQNLSSPAYDDNSFLIVIVIVILIRVSVNFDGPGGLRFLAPNGSGGHGLRESVGTSALPVSAPSQGTSEWSQIYFGFPKQVENEFHRREII